MVDFFFRKGERGEDMFGRGRLKKEVEWHKLTPYIPGIGTQRDGEGLFISVRTETWGRRMACWVICEIFRTVSSAISR